MISRFRTLTAAAAALSILIPFVAVAQEEYAVSMENVSPDGETTNLKATISPDKARMDMGDIASMVWGPEFWRMIQHAEQMWMEFDAAMMARMRQMMGNMPGAADIEDEIDDFDPASLTFTVTGGTDTVMDEECFEVAFTAGDGEEGVLCMSNSAPVGLFEVFGRMVEHLESLSGPMSGGDNQAAEMRNYMLIARAQGLPDGKVVKMTTADGAAFTMTGYELGPFGEDTWTAPSHYQKQALPFGG